VCYTDSTISLPLLTAYALTRHEKREPKRLYRRRDAMMKRLVSEYEKSERNEAVQEKARHAHSVTLDRDR
jgi:deoxyhypusine synthase